MNRNENDKNEKDTPAHYLFNFSLAPDPDYLSLSAITGDKGLSEQIFFPLLDYIYLI